jgi:hypothetical protein
MEKNRIDGKIIKKYDAPKTPFQRLKESKCIKSSIIKKLETQFSNLNPFILQAQIKDKIIEILNLSTFSL